MTRPVVVCVDDERPILAALSRLLRREPIELLTTEDPAEALRWAGDRDVALVISDQRMPGMTGLEMLGRLLRIAPRTVRVILTGYADSALNIHALDRVFHRMVVKPWDDGELKRLIRSWLDDREAILAEPRTLTT